APIAIRRLPVQVGPTGVMSEIDLVPRSRDEYRKLTARYRVATDSERFGDCHCRLVLATVQGHRFTHSLRFTCRRAHGELPRWHHDHLRALGAVFEYLTGTRLEAMQSRTRNVYYLHTSAPFPNRETLGQ